MRTVAIAGLAAACALLGADALYESANRKVEQIVADQAPPGSTIHLSPDEVNALVRGKIREKKIDGIRNPRVELGEGRGTWSGVVEFGKLPQLASLRDSFLVGSLLQDSKPVSATLRLESGGGKATIDVEQVTIGETQFTGSVLGFLVEKLILDDFPNAKLGEPFELEHNVDQIRIQPDGIFIKIKN